MILVGLLDSLSNPSADNHSSFTVWFLLSLDCIFVKDLTPETAFVKLGWVLG